MKIVAIGGGTGLSILLRGLKTVSSEITAVVTVSDDGGGSGVLREDLGMLPPGDIRNCILALANKEPILQDLFQYRFPEGRYKGQNFGNLMIAAMQGISDSFEDAVKKTSDIFAITGKVLPVVETEMDLYARLEGGTEVKGESNIPLEAIKRSKPIEKLWVEPKDLAASDEIVQAVEEADFIVLGPGSLYTSVIPNLLIENLARAINQARGQVLYVCNIMTQPGETDGFNVSDHVKAIFTQSYLKRIDLILVNSSELGHLDIEHYLSEDSSQVAYTEGCKAYFSNEKIGVVEDGLTEVVKKYVRHDAVKIAQVIASLANGEQN